MECEASVIPVTQTGPNLKLTESHYYPNVIKS